MKLYEGKYTLWGSRKSRIIMADNIKSARKKLDRQLKMEHASLRSQKLPTDIRVVVFRDYIR